MSERDLLAAEFALGLLTGEELLQARGLAATDADFAAAAAAWEERLAPMLDGAMPADVPAHLWAAIEEKLNSSDGGQVVVLQRRLARWRALAAGASAAAVLLLSLQLAPQRPRPLPASPTQVAQAEPMLVAAVAGDKQMALTVSYRPRTRELMVAPTGMAVPQGRARELWIIPAGEKPISLGMVEGEGTQRHQVAMPMARYFAAGATIAVTDEPAGKPPHGDPTGPVLAKGDLTTA